MKSHKLWIIFLIIYMKGTLTTVASSTGSPTTIAAFTGPPTTLAQSTDPPTHAPFIDPPTTLAPSCDPGEENCDCDFPLQECNCTLGLCGKIYAPKNGSREEPVILTYTLTDDPSVLGMVRMDASACQGLSSSSCNIELPDGQVITSCKNLEEYYITSSFNVTKKRSCNWTMTYIKYPFKNITTNLIAMSDVINVTSNITDPYGNFSGFSYRPNTQAHYILQTPESGYIINVNVSNQKLGVPFAKIHDEKAIYNATIGDIVLVGSGSSVLSGDETVLYGSKFMDTTRMRIDADVAHVSFTYSSGKNDVELNFNYSFTRKEVVTTTVPPTVITTPKPPSENYFTFAAINCIEPKIDVADRLKPAVKTKLAHIATKYGVDDLSLQLDHNITDDEVAIYNAKRCNPVKCNPEYCVAYNFSILYMNETGDWIFNKDIMDEMLLKYSGEFADLTPDRHCEDPGQLCDETSAINMVPYILVSVGVVVIGCIISFIVYKAGLGSVAREHKDKYIQENLERMEDERRRSSGNISMLGLGNTRGSLTSVSSSRKFSMPFPTKDKKSRNNVKYDVSGFKEFNPENSFGGEPVVLGLEKEFLGNPSTMQTYYSNDGFVPDQAVSPSRGRQQHWDNQDGSSSGSSSDNEDDGLSVPPLSQSHELARRQLQERLATIQGSESEGDNDSDQDVLFNRNSAIGVQLKPSVVPVDVHPYPEHEKETVL